MIILGCIASVAYQFFHSVLDRCHLLNLLRLKTLAIYQLYISIWIFHPFHVETFMNTFQYMAYNCVLIWIKPHLFMESIVQRRMLVTSVLKFPLQSQISCATDFVLCEDWNYTREKDQNNSPFNSLILLEIIYSIEESRTDMGL